MGNIIAALSLNKITEYLTEKSFFDIKIYDSLDSTSTFLRSLAENGEKEGTVIIAEQQTSGRGRLGRSFYSPKNSGIYMSILLRPSTHEINFDINRSIYITSATAVAVCRAIEKITKKDVAIKWVNDIYLNEKKICGILTEGSLNNKNTSFEYMIIGIGLNIRTSSFPNELKNIASSLLTPDDTDFTENIRNILVAEILNQFSSIYQNELSASPQKLEFLKEYKKRSFFLGKNINVIKNGTLHPAVAVDINDSCHLLVEYPDGSSDELSSGEISIRVSDLQEETQK